MKCAQKRENHKERSIVILSSFGRRSKTNQIAGTMEIFSDEIKGTIYEVRRLTLRDAKKRPAFNQGKAECPVKRWDIAEDTAERGGGESHEVVAKEDERAKGTEEPPSPCVIGLRL